MTFKITMPNQLVAKPAYTAKELRKLLGIADRTFYRWKSDGRIPEPAIRSKLWSWSQICEILELEELPNTAIVCHLETNE